MIGFFIPSLVGSIPLEMVHTTIGFIFRNVVGCGLLVAFPHFFNDREQKWYRLLQDKTDTGWFQALSDGSKQRWGRDYSKQ